MGYFIPQNDNTIMKILIEKDPLLINLGQKWEHLMSKIKKFLKSEYNGIRIQEIESDLGPEENRIFQP